MSQQLSTALDIVLASAIDGAKHQLQQLITEGKASAEIFIKSTAQELEEWIVALANGELSRDEFLALVDAQSIIAASYVTRQALEAQQRAEKLTVKTLEMAATKILPAIIAAI
jgi:hypothetical protein